jgi:VWFA-related protein
LKQFYKNILVIIMAILLVAAPLAAARAQTDSGWNIRVSLVSTLETPDSMLLKVYFNIFDPKTSLPILDNVAKKAQINLPQYNFTTDAQFKKPDVPIYVVMVLDASGSMGGAAEDLKKAAKLALANTPDNSFFSVVQFDESIQLLQDFTQNISAVTYAIDQYKVANKGTCLYDAAYSAIEGLQKAPPGRRAVIVFTDGRDESVNGKVCSKHTYQELVDLGMKDQVPVNTIGLSYKEGNINEVELSGMASSTGGFSAIAKQDNLGKAFESIMNVLKSQWMVETNIYPRRGANSVLMTLNLQDDQVLTASFPVTSNTDYPGPPSPVTAQFAGLELNAAEQAYEVQLNLSSPELVDYVKISVWDANAGSKAGEYVFKAPKANNSFKIPTEALTISRGYKLLITAVSKTDQTPFDIVRDQDGKLSKELEHDFTFDPSSAYPALQVQSLTEKNADLVLTINVTNPDLIGGFDGWLVDEDTNTQVAGSNFTSPAMNGNTGGLTIPLRTSGVPDGKYTVIVRVLAKNNNVYSTTTYAGVIYKAPTLFQRLGVALIAAPIFLFAILAVIVAVMAFLMFTASRQRAMSGTPVMQGQLGGKLKGSGRAAGPVIPIASDEPVLARGRVSPAAPGTPALAVPPRNSAAAGVPGAAARPSADATVIPGNGLSDSGATAIAATPVTQVALLTVLQAGGGNLPQGPVPVNQFPFVIGRTEGTLIISDQNISRRHAQIDYDANRRAYVLTDLSSSNGTRLNDQRLSPNQPSLLSSGALIRLGPNVTIRFDLR